METPKFGENVELPEKFLLFDFFKNRLMCRLGGGNTSAEHVVMAVYTDTVTPVTPVTPVTRQHGC